MVGCRLQRLTETSLVVRVDNVTHDYLAAADTAVVRALTVIETLAPKAGDAPKVKGQSWEGQDIRSGETTDGPAERPVVVVQERVLLLKTEPGLVVRISLHHLGALVTVVVLVWGAIGAPALGKDNDVGGSTERIGVDGAGAQIDVRVLAGSLLCGGAVKVPHGKVLWLVLFIGKSLLERITLARLASCAWSRQYQEGSRARFETPGPLRYVTAQ